MYNDLLFEMIHEHVLAGIADDREIAQYDYINELFVEQGDWTYGQLPVRNDNDEPFRFVRKYEQDEYDGHIEFICAFERKEKMSKRPTDHREPVKKKEFNLSGWNFQHALEMNLKQKFKENEPALIAACQS